MGISSQPLLCTVGDFEVCHSKSDNLCVLCLAGMHALAPFMRLSVLQVASKEKIGNLFRR